MKKLLTEKDYKILVKCAENFARKYSAINSDDVLSYLHEKIIPVLKRFDESYNVPYSAYITLNAGLLCRNYLRDEANSLKISKQHNYVQMESNSLLKTKPDLIHDISGEKIAKELKITPKQYQKVIRDGSNKFNVSLDEHSFLETLANVNPNGESISPEALVYLQTLEDDEIKILTKYINGKFLGEKATRKAEKIISKIEEIVNLQTLEEF